jgi:hypothetical protein
MRAARARARAVADDLAFDLAGPASAAGVNFPTGAVMVVASAPVAIRLTPNHRNTMRTELRKVLGIDTVRFSDVSSVF